MNRHAIRLCLVACLVCLPALPGCMKLGATPVDKHYYDIAVTRTGPPTAQASPQVLKLGRLDISELYDQREMVYRLPKGAVESDFYNTFVINPAPMLTQELKDWLTASGIFAHVVAPGSLAGQKLTLEGVVNTLCGDYTGAEPSAVVEMQFFLIDESTLGNDIVFSGDYRQRIPLAEQSPEALVAGFTQATRAIFTDLERDLTARMAATEH